MREVFSAVVVIGLVLVAVFVPVAFFPGTTGRLYQQFSLTIAFAVVLSVFNAVTFTPALAALLLDKEPHAHGWFFSFVNRVIEGGTNVYVRALRFALRLAHDRCCCCSPAVWARRGRSIAPCRRRSCRTRTKATSSPSSRRRPGRRWNTRRTSRGRPSR